MAVKKPAPPAQFKGFPRDCLKFLRALKRNNSRDWFMVNKQRYEDSVREPALDFIECMGPRMEKISEHIECIPAKVGGSLFRIHRDVRFSNDKTPYKTHVGIHFRHEVARDAHAPGYYLHVGLDECFIGGGMWLPPGDALFEIRTRIVERPAEWKKVKRSRKLCEAFDLSGDSLKRPPRGFPKEHEFIDDLKRKSFIAIAPFDDDLLFSAELLDFAAEKFAAAAPLMNFLCRSQSVPF